MPTIPEALAIALMHHKAGRLATAERIYRQILAVEPNHAESIHLLGAIAHQAGQHGVAAEYVRRAIDLKATEAVFHNTLGEAYRALRRTPEAIASYRRALELKPDLSEAHNNLGFTLRELGRLDEAVASYRQALGLRPGDAMVHRNLGVVLSDQGHVEEAIACYRRSLELDPNSAETLNNLGVALHGQGKQDGAVACFRRALALEPGHARAHSNLAAALRGQGNLDAAVCHCRAALEVEPDFAEAHYNLGDALGGQGKVEEAIASYRRALQLRPDYAEAHNNLGNALRDRGKLGEALASYRRALELQPSYAGAHNNLGNVLKDHGKLDEALASYRRALELKPNFAEARSNLLSTLQYQPGASLAELAAAHAEFDRIHAAPLRPGPRTPNTQPRARRGHLRVGFISPDFGRHPVGYFLVRTLENLGRQRQETICYSDRVVGDDLTGRLRAAAAHWRDVASMSDQQLVDEVRADKVDVLFDLAGHTAGGRLLVFARKPAPIQVTWAGYAGTTGLAAMDYILADRYEIPPGAERYYQERVLCMPDGYVCYDPPEYAPPVTPLPGATTGFVTFGCFNNPAKITPQVIEAWARILRRSPGARLALRFKGWDDHGLVGRYAALFAAHGIGPDRFELLGAAPHAALLAEYGRVDLALDPFPYSGGLTTCEALWMGVPVVACPGETFASRHSFSHLSNVGLTETIARDLDGYVEIAVALANDLPRLAAIRARLRQQMAASPLCDGKRFATNFAAVLRDAWRRWCVQGEG